MSTLQELREKARELGIENRSKLRKAELLAAIQEALHQLAPLPSCSSDVYAKSPPQPQPELPAPPPPAPQRRHPHTGARPLLTPLELPDLADTYDLRHLAVLAKGPRAVVVAWSLTRDDWARAAVTGAVLRVCCEDGLAHTGSLPGALGRFFVGGLRPDQHVWAEVAVGPIVLATSRRVALPPEAPSRLHHPLMATVDIDRPLSDLPRDLRRGAPVPPPDIPGRATASERLWRRATAAPAVPSDPTPRFAGAEPADVIDPRRHAELVSSFVHALSDEVSR